MNIRKGHLTGFLTTVLVFGIIFLYLYLNTLETGWLYDIKNATKENLGRNVYNVVFSDNEEYMAKITYKGNLNLVKTINSKESLYSVQNINTCFFCKDLLVMTNKEGDTFSYNIKTKEKINYKFDSFNKYICLIKNYLLAADYSSVKIMNLDNDNEIKEYKIKDIYNSNNDIFLGDDYICLFSENNAYVYKYPEFNQEIYDIKDYASNGIYKNNKFIYVNSKGETVIGGNIVIKDIINPHSVCYSEKTNLILVANNKKIACFNELGIKIWENDMLSNNIVMNNKGTEFASLHNKIQTAVYDIKTKKEKFSMDILQKVVFSDSDNLIFAVKKSNF